jgi:RNase H-like domain found in reverse transcriptase
MCQAPMLVITDFQQTFILETDTCETGIRVVLMQHGNPIAYFSKSLSIKAQSLSTYENELFALILAVQKLCHYLQSCPFVIKTDHVSLKYLFERRLNHTLQHKGLCKLLGLDYTMQYKKGCENVIVDALSRRAKHGEEVSEHFGAASEIILVWLNELKESCKGDEWVKLALKNKLNETEKEKVRISLKAKG